MRRHEWKLSDPEAQEVIRKNAELMDKIKRELSGCCGNPACRYPLQSGRDQNYALPEYGDVCAVCYHMHAAITFSNPQLRNPKYFVNLHDKWLRELRDRKRND